MTSAVTPLQLTSGYALLNNQGLRPLPAALVTAINLYNSQTVVQNLLNAISWYKAQVFYTESTFDSLLSIGSTSCPALGNSIPAGSLANLAYLTNAYITGNSNTDDSTFDPSGLSNFIEQLGAAELGNGDVGKFCQGFLAVYSYANISNQFITSNVNASTYLGPTYTGMNALTTADIASINPVFDRFGADIARQGQLVNLKNLDLYGTPAGLLQQLSAVAKIQNQALPVVQSALLSVGLQASEIADLINNNRVSVFNPNGLTDNQFDKLQKRAYPALSMVTGDNLQQALDILDVTTPGINSLADLLDPIKVFPLSYTTLMTPSPTGPQFIFDSNTGAVNGNIAPIVNSYLPTASGCDELGKIIPQASATANKAIQVGLQNIPGIANTNWPAFGEAVSSFVDNPWDSTQEYLPNTVVSVSNGADVPQYYRSQEEVPAGANITDTAYWQPEQLGNLVTMQGLDLVQSQEQVIDPAVTAFYENSIATGSGKYGTILITDILGTSVDSHNFAAALTSVANSISSLQGAGTLATLNTALTNLILAANDAGVLTEIANANSAISALSTATKDALNTLWIPMATAINSELEYQTEAGVDYFTLSDGTRSIVYSFIQSLPTYAQNTESGQAWDYLTQAIDTAVLGGQGVIGSIREAYNIDRIEQTGISARSATQVPLGAVPGGDFVTAPADSALYDTYPKTRSEIST